jgi:hypothetical protein
MKIRFNSILLLAIILSGILIVSCKKEQSPNVQNEIPANDLRLANMIKNFRAKGESGLKSTAEMTIDSAIWYIGATANYTYGDASRETERTWTDSIFITLPVSNGKISESEVFNKYEQVIDSLRTIYQAKNEENKQLLAVAVETHSVSSTTLICKVTGIFAAGILPTNRPCTFNDIDYYNFYYLYNYQAICDGPNTQSPVITDAAEETQKRIMWCKPMPAGNFWYDDIKVKPINDPVPIPGRPIGNDRYSYLYWNSTEYPDPKTCISPADLNFYLAKTKEYINREEPDPNVPNSLPGFRPAGHSFIDIDMIGDWYNILSSGHTIYQHKATVRYGILHFSNDPPQSL